jgi:hypothetical protein
LGPSEGKGLRRDYLVDLITKSSQFLSKL